MGINRKVLTVIVYNKELKKEGKNYEKEQKKQTIVDVTRTVSSDTTQ